MSREAGETLAFVLAHEMIHSILEDERQALTYAQLLLPRQIVRSVTDMYVEIELNASLLMAMEPVMQQGEYEADELGMLLASAAGFDPDTQNTDNWAKSWNFSHQSAGCSQEALVRTGGAGKFYCFAAN